MQSELNKKFGKVAVLFGGNSREREISLQSGNAVLNALKEKSINAVAVDTQNLDIDILKDCDRAFIALHGVGGEDGHIQALLEYLDIPYTGSGVAASAIAMDKVLSKKIWSSVGLRIADSFVVADIEEAKEKVGVLGLPVIFKPSLEGSSVGISKVNTENQVIAAFHEANKPGQQVLVEKFIVGDEFSVGIVSGEVLPSVRLSTKREFYDFQAKYLDDDTQYFCPAGLSDSEEKELAALAKKAFVEIGCSGWGRVDFIREKSGKFFLLEVNTVPGLTSHSLVPMEAKVCGYGFSDLVIKILETSFEKIKK
jgi:D-alanine-D-alanine ligase